MRKIIFISFFLITVNYANAQIAFIAGESGLGERFFAEQLGDARSIALGNNGILGVVGSNGLFLNPAQLANIKEVSYQISGRIHTGSIDNELIGDEYQVDYAYSPHFKISNISLAKPFAIDAQYTLVGAIGYRTVFDAGYKLKWDFSIPDDFEGSTNWESKGGYSVLASGIGLHFDNGLNVGLSYHIPFLSETEVDTDSEIDFEDEFSRHRTSEITGSYLLFGVSRKLTDKITTGIIYRSSIEIIEKYKENNSDDFSQRGKKRLDMPSVIGLAGAYKINEKSTVFGEYQSRNFTKWELDGEKSNIDDDPAFKFGLEYLMQYPVRIGYYSDHLPDTNLDETDDAPISINGLTLGMGDIKALDLKTDIYLDFNWWIIEDEIGNAYVDRAIIFGASITGSF